MTAQANVTRGTDTASVYDFREIFDTNLKFVWRSLVTLGVRQSDVLDQAQKVFLTAHAKLAEFEGRSKITTWLFEICLRVASDYRRAAKSRLEVPTEIDVLDLYPKAQRDPHREAESRQLVLDAERILSKIPEEQRIVFVLFELDDLNGQDIAELLGIAIGTVRSRLRLARATFSREAKRLALRDTPERAV